MIFDNLTEKKLYMYTFLTFVLVTGIFLYVRSENFNLLPAGSESYFHARIAKFVNTPGLENDQFMQRYYIFNPYHIVLHYFYDLGILKVMLVFPIIFSILSLLVLLPLLKKVGPDIEKRLIFVFILTISPASIYSIATSDYHTFALFLGVSAFYLYFQDTKVTKTLSTICFLIVPLFGLIETVIATTFLFGLFFIKKKKYIPFLIIAIFSVYLINFDFTFDVNSNLSQIQSSVTDFGGTIGFGIFSLIIAGMGLIYTWRFKKQHYSLYIVIIILFISSTFFGTYTNIYLNFIFAYLGSLSLSRLINSKWEINWLKYSTILVIILGLLFSSLSFLDRISNSDPDTAILNSLNWLKENSDNDVTILSSQDKGFWIEFFSERKVVADTHTKNDEILGDIDTIFESRNLEKTKNLLSKYNVKYIWIDSKMKSGQVWQKEEQGLLFLFKDKETFEKVFERENIEIWKVI